MVLIAVVAVCLICECGTHVYVVVAFWEENCY